MMKRRAILYGASTMGQASIELLKVNYNIIAFCDGDTNKHNSFVNGIKVYSLDDIQNINHDVLIITSSQYEDIGKKIMFNTSIKNIEVFTFGVKQYHKNINYIENKEEINCYLSGNKFNDILNIDFTGTEVFKTRNDVISQIINNKKIVHIGCTDHKELIEERFKSDVLLHKVVTNEADKCIGVDINKEAVEEASKFFNNVICADITKDYIENIINERWDYFMIPDVLEHLENPIEFLREIIKIYSQSCKKYLISVPNAYGSYSDYSNNIEVINSDHKYNFTPYTIIKLLTQAGLSVKKVIMCGKTEEVNALQMPNIVILAFV